MTSRPLALATTSTRSASHVIESHEHTSRGHPQRNIEEAPTVLAKQIGTGVVVRHALATVLHAVPSVIVLKVMDQAVKDAVKIFAGSRIAERDELEEDVERLGSERKRRPVLDRYGRCVRHDLTEAGHVENDSSF